MFYYYKDSKGEEENSTPAVASFLRKLGRKLSVCLAEVVDFVSYPPRLRASLSAHPTPVPLFVNSVDFCGFRVGDGGGYYMDSIQPILYIFRVSV